MKGREVEALDGLALMGRGPVGPFEVDLPTLLYAETLESSNPETQEFRLSAPESSVPGQRSVVLHRNGAEFRLDFPILAPEITGSASVPVALPHGSFLLHWPLSEPGWNALAEQRPNLLILGNARALFRDGEPFIRAVAEIRQRCGGNPVLWLPRVALPHRLAFLVWAGADLLDSTEAEFRATEGEFLDRQLGVLASAEGRGGCEHPACRQASGSLVTHAALALREELQLVRSAGRAGRLRELVEARLTTEPALSEMLRYADREWAGLLEERTPVVGGGVRGYVLAEAQRRPEILRFRHRFIERYRPPACREVLVLVPCSRTKPYRQSRSHRRLARAFEGLQHPERFHVVSVTSPLGLVPRELEDVYPARHYDIPVTGDWSGPEREAVLAALRHLLASRAYRTVVVHLDPVEYAFVRTELSHHPRTIWTAPDDRTTSPEAIDALRQALQQVDPELERLPGGPLAAVRQDLAEIAGFQWGREAARDLFHEPIRLAGRPWFQRLHDGHGHDLASWREERGLFHLTVPGALRMGNGGANRVEIAPGFELLGDLFTPGVVGADPSIRIGDSVSLFRSGELVGVGEAMLPGRLMLELPTGLAVRVRHRRHVSPGASRQGDDPEAASATSGPVV